jgi:hypothetical protein
MSGTADTANASPIGNREDAVTAPGKLAWQTLS